MSGEPRCRVVPAVVEAEQADRVRVAQRLGLDIRVACGEEPSYAGLIRTHAQVGGKLVEDGDSDALAALGCLREVRVRGIADRLATAERAPRAKGHRGGAGELYAEGLVGVFGEFLELGHGSSFAAASLSEAGRSPRVESAE